jgi:N-hydroxyarylamine O-acetyltransferase
LSRLDLGEQPITPDVDFLRRLQRGHLINVPFENLDIHWKRPIVLDGDKLYAKIVGGGRGGFCYELNGLFNLLLRECGFETRLVSARVHDGNNGYSPEFDHCAIIVVLRESEYLVDVGFGDFIAEPLELVSDIRQQDRVGDFMIRQADNGWFDVAKWTGDAWVSEYIFEPVGHGLAEFTEMCDFHQFSPDSHFSKGKVCSLLTAAGRKTLTDRKFILTAGGQKTEKAVGSEEEFASILIREFGIRAPGILNI